MSTEIQRLLKDAERNDDKKSHQIQWRYYFKLTRLHFFPQVGANLLFFPSVWGLTMAACYQGLPPQSIAMQTFAFAIGSYLLMGAACVLNDICDVDFDRQVERCKNRPLAAGVISVSGAWILLAMISSAAVSMLLLTNSTAACYGLFGVFPLHAIYPFMKRWTWWPQAWLGLAMNWGLIVSWISMTESVNTTAIPVLFLGTVSWTIVYDTMYACQDRKDDVKAGVKSTAVLFGDWVQPILAGFAVIFILCLTIAGALNGQGIAFYTISIGGSIIFFLWQFLAWKPDVPSNCLFMFKSTGILGIIVWIGLLTDCYYMANL